jgi:hypothetical protein
MSAHVCSRSRHGPGRIEPRRCVGMFWVGLFSSRLILVRIESQEVVELEEGKWERRTTSAIDERVSWRSSKPSHQDIVCMRRNVGVMGARGRCIAIVYNNNKQPSLLVPSKLG